MYSTFHIKTETVTASIMRGTRRAANSPAVAAGLDDGSLAVRCVR
jgi:hypothetical protein